MTPEETQAVMIRGLIAGLTDSEQAQVKQAYEKIKTVLQESGDAWPMALALIGAEMAAEEL